MLFRSHPRRGEGQAFDSYEAGGTRTVFDGNPGKQKLSEQEYLKVFSTADELYSRMLTALLTQLRTAAKN